MTDTPAADVDAFAEPAADASAPDAAIIGTDAFAERDAFTEMDAFTETDAFTEMDAFAPDAYVAPDAYAAPDAFDPCARCNVNAVCLVATCSCLPGFTGDGVSCTRTTLGGATLEAFGKPSNTSPFDSFGYSVALSSDGSTMAVGAYQEDSSTSGINSVSNDDLRESGAVYVYRRSGLDWLFDAYIKASNPGESDQFGFDVALSADGNTLVVGATQEGSSSPGVNPLPDELASASGAVYVFQRSVAGWSQQAFIKASNPEAGDNFGLSVAVSGDGNLIGVGAWREASSGTGVGSVPNEAASGAGAAYLYRRVGAVWAFEAFVKASNTGMGDNFGYAVALSGDGETFAVGSIHESSSGTGPGGVQDDLSPESGAVYVYRRTGAEWRQEEFIKASNTDAGDYFGWSVSLSGNGDTLAVGAWTESGSGVGVNPPSNEGSLFSGAGYVYQRTGATWSFDAYIKATNTGSRDNFGQELCLSANGRTLAVGARNEGSSSVGVGGASNELAPESGAVYVYERVAGSWRVEAFVKATNPQRFDYFGTAVALNGEGSVLAVGAYNESSSGTGLGSSPDEGATYSGAVYVYR